MAEMPATEIGEDLPAPDGGRIFNPFRVGSFPGVRSRGSMTHGYSYSALPGPLGLYENGFDAGASYRLDIHSLLTPLFFFGFS